MKSKHSKCDFCCSNLELYTLSLLIVIPLKA